MHRNKVHSDSETSDESEDTPQKAWPEELQVNSVHPRDISGPSVRIPMDTSAARSTTSDMEKVQVPRTFPSFSPFGVETFAIIFKYVLADFRRHQRTFVIGIFTVFIVVFFVTLLQNSILNVPLIFMRLAEEEVGETDILLTPQFAQDSDFFFNFTEIKPILEESSRVAGVVPRTTFFATVWNPSNPAVNVTAALLIIDTKAEYDIDLGRALNQIARPLKDEEAWASGPLLRQLGIRPNYGEKIHISYGLDAILDPIGGDVLGQAGGLGGLLGAGNNGALLNGLVGGQVNLTEEQRRDIAQALTDAIVTDDFVTNTQENLNGTTTIELENIDIGDNLARVIVPANITIEPQDEDVTRADIEDVVFEAVFDAVPASLDINNSSDNGTSTGFSLDEDVTRLLQYFVIAGIEDPIGKWPRALGNVVVVDMKFVTKAWSRSLEKTLIDSDAYPLLRLAGASADDFRGLADGINLMELVPEIHVKVKDRLKLYSKTSDAATEEMTLVTNDVIGRLDKDNKITVTTPVLLGLALTNFIRLFLDQIFQSVMIILVGLGSILIYSLLLSDVETKTYEYGMLRGLGMRQKSLIVLLFVQSMFYAVPGIVLGMVLAQIGFIPARVVLENFARGSIIVVLEPLAIALGLGLGLLMPIVSNIGPIRRALSKTLRDSLDLYHQTFSEVTVTVVKLENLGLSLGQSIISILLVATALALNGMMTAFIFGDFSLFLTILNFILVGMLVGLSVVSLAIQPWLEKLLLWLILWGREARLHTVVSKNMAAHRSRNRKTAIMFTTSIAFVVFAGAMFALQANSIKANVEQFSGADLVAQSNDIDEPLDEKGLKRYLDGAVANGSYIDDYTFITFPLDSFEVVRISSLSGYRDRSCRVYGVNKDYLLSTFDTFYIPAEVASGFDYRSVNNFPDAIYSLFADKGQQRFQGEPENILDSVPPLVLSGKPTSRTTRRLDVPLEESYVDYVDVIPSESLRLFMSIDTGTALRLELRMKYFDENVVGSSGSGQDVSSDKVYLSKARALAAKIPGFTFSSYSQSALFGATDVLVDNALFSGHVHSYQLQDYSRLMNDVWSVAKGSPDLPSEIPPEETPKQRLLVKFKELPLASSTEIRRLKEEALNNIRTYLGSNVIVTDVKALADATQLAIDVIIIFFNVVSVISSFLCFFALWMQFTTNMRENSWEFGVLRALGFSVKMLYRTYIYEAFCLITSSLLLGSVIGIAIACTLTLQFNLFTELPFVFLFPTAIFVTLTMLSLLVAIAGSFFPTRELVKYPIAFILRGIS